MLPLGLPLGLPWGARVFAVVGAVAGCGAVAMAAVAAHALPQRLDARALAAVQSAIQMQGWHAIALVLTALWLVRLGGGAAYLAATAAGIAFTLGLLLFCGAVYAHDIGGVRLGPVAPAGGFLLMAGWLLLAASALLDGGPKS
jgi:uncharacterized membrane protein YgdD (TMEM256/DUF423 family)